MSIQSDTRQGYDPLKLGEAVQGHVVKGDERKYYRFRGGRWYGGIATADCVGCNLRCVFCWGWKARDNFKTYGEYYEPEDVYRRLVDIATRKKYRYVRVSGNEPTLAWTHLLKILELFDQDGRFRFILETNGIVIGADKSRAKDLSNFGVVQVRVSLKGTSEEEFRMLTGARSEFFSYQLKALENLLDYGVRAHPAVMLSFSSEKNIQELRARLASIDKRLVEEFEEEYVFLYPHVVTQLERSGLKPRIAYEPHNIPGELV